MIRGEYRAHALFERDLGQGVAHAVVRAGSEVERSGRLGPRKTFWGRLWEHGRAGRRHHPGRSRRRPGQGGTLGGASFNPGTGGTISNFAGGLGNIGGGGSGAIVADGSVGTVAVGGKGGKGGP
jgi:hypothetical protein